MIRVRPLQALALLTFLGLSLPQLSVAQGDPAAGEAQAGTCAACHGMDGNSTVAQWPKIAGQHEAYLDRHITLIRDGARPVPEMQGIVAGLSDQDIANLSAYFAAQDIKMGVADESLVPLGRRIYQAGNSETGVPACMACHGPVGEGNPLAGYPRLSGQHALYTANMLKKYRDGAQWGEDDVASRTMSEVAAELTDDEIEAVASYLAGLHMREE